MSRIAENLYRIRQELPSTTQLIVVSKTRAIEEIREVYDAGHRIFAENRVQALMERAENLPQDIEWHLIGHLQSNKVKYIAPFIAMIHSVDSLSLLEEINRQAAKYNRNIPCLIQLHIAQEETKFGLDVSEIDEFFQSYLSGNYANVTISGIMAMASFTDDENKIEAEFALVNDQFNKIKNSYFNSSESFREISIGMSSDYRLAIKNGSTMVRVGSAIFA